MSPQGSCTNLLGSSISPQCFPSSSIFGTLRIFSLQVCNLVDVKVYFIIDLTCISWLLVSIFSYIYTFIFSYTSVSNFVLWNASSCLLLNFVFWFIGYFKNIWLYRLQIYSQSLSLWFKFLTLIVLINKFLI